MKIRARFSRHKCYLSGMDWFVRAMDCRTRAATGIGSYSQVVLRMRGRLDPAVFRSRLRAFIEQNPVLAGHCRRDILTLAPYWAVPQSVNASTGSLLDVWPTACNPGSTPLPPALVDEVNRKLPGRYRIAFTLAYAGERSYLAMRFDHQILDAGGAERLLLRLSGDASKAGPLPLEDRHLHLDHWRDKFRSGQVVNRALLALRGPASPVALPLPGATGRIRSLFAFRSFSESETNAIVASSESNVGYLMLLPFLLGVCVHVFHEHCRQAGLSGSHYVVPVTMNARRAGGDEKILFNRLSFNFYRFDRIPAADQASCWKMANVQLYRQTRDRIAHHVAQAGYLMRILPAGWLGRLMGLPLSGTLGSFSFALVTGEGYPSNVFMGIPVDQVYHMPRVPAPPGIGLYFNRYQGRLNLVLSYLENMLSAADAETLVDRIAERLRHGESSPR